MNIIRPPGSSTLPRFRPVDNRKRIKVVAITLAAVAMIGTGAWAFGVNSGGKFTYKCSDDDYVPPTPDRVTVNVYNGTQVVGLGTEIAEELSKRNFVIGAVGNDPIRRKIRGTGELRYGPAAEQTNLINTLRSWQPGMVLVKDMTLKGPEVDFVLGVKFESLRDTPAPPPGTPKSACTPETAD